MPRPQPPRRGSAVYRRALLPLPPVNGFTTQILAPVNGASTRAKRPILTVVGTSAISDPVDIQVEWRTVKATQAGTNPTPSTPWLPAATYTTTLEDAVSGTQQSIQPPADLLYTTWWYRVRTGNSTTNVWGAWTPQFFLSVYPVMGSAEKYIDMNVGVENAAVLNAVAYIEMNVGVVVTPEELTAAYIEMNVGLDKQFKIAAEYLDMNIFQQLAAYKTAEYSDLNVVTDETPLPHIWWIRPEQGREGYVFNIYGHGFGSFQNEFDGKVMLGNLECVISRWEIQPMQGAVTVALSGHSPFSGTLPAYLKLKSESLVFAAGDTIEYQMQVADATSASDVGGHLHPYFKVNGIVMGTAPATLADIDGVLWGAHRNQQAGQWYDRKYVISPGSYLVGKTATDFGLGFYGVEANDGTDPAKTGQVSSFVIRNAAGVPKLWVTGDDGGETLMEFVTPAEGFFGTLDYANIYRTTSRPQRIEHGTGLAGDVILPEHGWIVAIVPTGAVSSMVQVVLEDD